MASIIKRKKNYSVIYSYVDENGENKQKWETYHTHNEALKRKAEIENQQFTGTFLSPSNQTITEFLYDFVSLYGEKKWGVSMYDSQTALIANYINPIIGNMQVQEITPRVVDEYIQMLQKTKAVATRTRRASTTYVSDKIIEKIIKLLRCAFKQAVRWEIIARNPFDNVILPKTEYAKRDIDMYPLYWTPSRGGIIMRYTYEYKRKCVELYREGKWPETPEGVSNKSFRDKVRLWVRAEDSRGPEALKHKNFNRNWTPEERLELVSQVMSGKSCVSVAIEAGIQDRLLYQWVQNYKTKGYNGLVEMKKGRPSKGVPQMKKEEARPLNESEREELIRLRAENEYIKAENEVIKKEIALREERHAAQLKARKQRSSKSCVKKDTN